MDNLKTLTNSKSFLQSTKETWTLSAMQVQHKLPAWTQ